MSTIGPWRLVYFSYIFRRDYPPQIKQLHAIQRGEEQRNPPKENPLHLQYVYGEQPFQQWTVAPRFVKTEEIFISEVRLQKVDAPFVANIKLLTRAMRTRSEQDTMACLKMTKNQRQLHEENPFPDTESHLLWTVDHNGEILETELGRALAGIEPEFLSSDFNVKNFRTNLKDFNNAKYRGSRTAQPPKIRYHEVKETPEHHKRQKPLFESTNPDQKLICRDCYTCFREWEDCACGIPFRYHGSNVIEATEKELTAYRLGWRKPLAKENYKPRTTAELDETNIQIDPRECEKAFRKLISQQRSILYGLGYANLKDAYRHWALHCPKGLPPLPDVAIESGTFPIHFPNVEKSAESPAQQPADLAPGRPTRPGATKQRVQRTDRRPDHRSAETFQPPELRKINPP